ncbi:MAG: sigma-54 dependent transcriptional regulator [bacterium]
MLKVAPTPGRVLITGESGTGKELAAYAVHKNSTRSQGPFVKINCAAIPQNLIESELFGHEKGAFTGAINKKKGKFEMAHNGTLLLDEIGDMDLTTQIKVLRVLQDGEFERVGGVAAIKTDVRVIAATNRDLPAMVKEGKFREDLYYRLNVVPLHMPSLNRRHGDIAQLASYFLNCFCMENGTNRKTFAPSALEILSTHNYPGNIRQLKNIVERIAIMTEFTEIEGGHIKGFLNSMEKNANSLFTKPRSIAIARQELEREFVKIQLEQNSWDIPRTAAVLDIQRTNLHRKIRQLGIEKKV